MFVYSTMQVRNSGLIFNNISTYTDDDVSEICVYMKYCIRLVISCICCGGKLALKFQTYTAKLV